MQIAGAALEALKIFHSIRPKNVTMRAQVHAMLDRALQKLSKLLHDLQNIHPWWANSADSSIERP